MHVALSDTQKKVLENLNRIFGFLSKLLLLLITVSVFVPFSPKLPAQGIDSSWALGLNQAVAQGLAFGKEIIFTLGPYSSIYTKAYHPATHLMMNAGSLYLAISYWVALLFLMKNTRWYWPLIFCVPLFGMMYARDSLFFSYALLVGLISFKVVCGEKNTLNSNNTLLLLIGFLFAPFGLFALIKGSMLILCFAVTWLSFVFFLVNKQVKFAVMCLSSSIVSLILFWLAAGQSIIYLPNYLISSFSIASGFSEAMSTTGNNNEVILFLIIASLIFLLILWHKQVPIGAKLFLFCIFFAFLFMSFKTGFTRHMGHGFIPGTSVLLAGLFLPFLLNSNATYFLLFVSLGCWNYINGHYTKISILDNFKSSYSATWHGLKSIIQDRQWMEKNFTFAMSFLREQAGFPLLQGTTDIYSYNQSYLISSQNVWSPRPIFQSYSVFTPNLAEKNKKHLQERQSPDNIIFKIEPIDGRVPSLEDGASWSPLLTHYKPTNINNGFLFLRKRKTVSKENESLLRNEHHILGELVVLSEQKSPVFATIAIQPTIWGKLATIFFKPNQLQIVLHLKNGTMKHYRFIASMAKSGFLLSPHIENTIEFSLLYQKNDDLNGKTVKSFMITTNPDNGWFWNHTYTITYYSKI
ncbi:transmembrane protein [Legionella gratiana]|uniref:Transmembrane protein n=1 Tax=Legionella gratiana TaxID=45066 RepID=A0A378J9F7_9GAMM|nr:hypothetical protein [Legionella gratiana]KTD11111.1 transmembrane protein [Legionella gratiana]STX44474.1 transmembrane protein [Legionella gratiana]